MMMSITVVIITAGGEEEDGEEDREGGKGREGTTNATNFEATEDCHQGSRGKVKDSQKKAADGK